jgi:type I restriction enzyme S subunit
LNQSKALPSFARYFTSSFSYWQWLSSIYIQATIQNVSAEKYADLVLPSAPLPEQRAIADFLDRETAKLDTLAAKKRELIEKLKEKRTALISRTVTAGLPPEAARAAGLDPHPKLKPSGIEWLGEVPEHWEVKRVKYIGTIRYGLGEPPEYVDEGLAFIRATDVKRGKIDLDSVRKVSPADIPWSRRPLLSEDEILVVRSGAYTGDSAIVTKEVAGNIAGYDMVLTVTKDVSHFVAWIFLSKYMLESQIHLSRLRAAQPHLNAEELGNFIVLIPPVSEQRAIADYLDRETAKIDQMATKVEKAIARLQEYRTALITAAVTGKIDVRGTKRNSMTGRNFSASNLI